ncbi:hypothetical protein LG290_12530 [Halomonas sediminis]
MLNNSRKVSCSNCGEENAWKGTPRPEDKLFCQHCESFIMTYEDYIYNVIQKEVQRLIDEHFDPNPANDHNRLIKTLENTQPPTARRINFFE